MLTWRIVPLILASSAATLLPRILPYFVNFSNNLPRFVRKCVAVLPIAALGALIFPAILIDFKPYWYAGLCGIVVAALIAWWRGGMVLPIVSSIATTYLVLSLV